MFINLVNIYISHCIAFIVTFFWNEYIFFSPSRSAPSGYYRHCRRKHAENHFSATEMNKTMVKLFVSPNRENLKFKVAKVKKDETVAQLTCLVNELKEKGPLTPQTLIFCCTVWDIARIVKWFLVKLDSAAFSPRTSRKREDCLIGIYHFLTVESNKERLAKGLKEDGVTRVVLATTALIMGVNFPHIRRVIMYGPPRSILDFHQEAGRAGRDGLPSEVTL